MDNLPSLMEDLSVTFQGYVGGAKVYQFTSAICLKPSNIILFLLIHADSSCIK